MTRVAIRRLAAVLVFVTATATATVVPAVAASATAAQLTGSVTDAVTGQPIARACAEVWDDGFSFVGQACTTAAGTWRLGKVKAGALYEVDIQASGYADEWGGGKFDINDAKSYTAPASIAVALERPGDISGTLLNANGTAPSAAYVSAVRVDEANAQYQVNVDPTTGAWDASSVPPGSYQLQYQSDPVIRWAPDQVGRRGAQTYVVNSGQSVSADLTLPKPIIVTGTVTSAASGLPVQGICVIVGGLEGAGIEGNACTNASGVYRVQMPQAGAGYVEFYDRNGSYGTQFFPAAPNPARATRLSYTDGTVLKGIDAVMAAGATITGVAVDSLTHQPLENACSGVNFGHSGGFPMQEVTTCTGADGRFTISGLSATAYAVSVSTSDSMTGWAPSATSQATATLYTPTAGQTLDIGDLAVAPGGSVSGTVVDAATGLPLKGIIVGMYGARVGDGGLFSATTNAAGHYLIPHIPAGPQPLVAWTFSPAYAPSWFGGATDPSTATPVMVVDGRTSHADFALVAGATISGTLVDANGVPVTKTYSLDAFSLATPNRIIGISSDVTRGHFSITGLPATPVILQFSPAYNDKAVFYYDGSTTSGGATSISPVPGQTITITSHLP